MVKRSRKVQNEEEEMPVLTKEEKQVANHLRFNFKNRQGNLMGMKVDYFGGNKIVDFLMESKFGPGTLQDIPKDAPYEEGKMPLLDTRQACVKYMQRLMSKQIFYRAIKIYKEQSVVDADETPSNLRKRKTKESKEDESKANESSPVQSSPQSEKKEQKKKFKLEMHEDQKFVDANEPFVWNYDPVSTKNYIIGGLLILGAIAICCFPLWPQFIREGVYYLSLAGCGFLGGIIGLAVIKYILYTVIYILTIGKVEFWIFPNLTEDVGFTESFLPVYTLKTSTPVVAKDDAKEKETKETNETAESKEEIEECVENKKTSTDTHKMNDLTESTVEVTTVEGSGSVENMDKIQEDYDFELVDTEENKEAEEN